MACLIFTSSEQSFSMLLPKKPVEPHLLRKKPFVTTCIVRHRVSSGVFDDGRTEPRKFIPIDDCHRPQALAQHKRREKVSFRSNFSCNGFHGPPDSQHATPGRRVIFALLHFSVLTYFPDRNVCFAKNVSTCLKMLNFFTEFFSTGSH